MKISEHGLAIIKAFESCMKAVPGRPGYFKPYDDGVGVLTIGWGHTNHHEPKFDKSAVWSQAECDAALVRDLAIFEAQVNRFAKVPLAQHEFDALVSWAYNTGGPATAGVWTQLNAGNKAAVPARLAQWNKGGGKVMAGLVRRRKAEGLLFSGEIVEAYRVAEIKGQPPAPSAPGQALDPASLRSAGRGPSPQGGGGKVAASDGAVAAKPGAPAAAPAPGATSVPGAPTAAAAPSQPRRGPIASLVAAVLPSLFKKGA